MNKIEEFVFKFIVNRQVRQGIDHDKRITHMYKVINEACYDEFYEDNTPTVDGFLTDCFNDSQKLKGKV